MPRDPEERSILVDLLNLCLEWFDGLDAQATSDSLPSGEGAGPAGIALRAARDMIEHEDDPDYWIAAMQIRDASKRAAAPESGSCPAGSSAGLTDPVEPLLGKLQEIASLFVRLEPEDSDGLAKVGEQLQALSLSAALRPSTQALVREASERVTRVASGQAADPRSEFEEAGHLIERSSDAFEEELLASTTDTAGSTAGRESSSTQALPSGDGPGAGAATSAAQSAPSPESHEPAQPEADETCLPADADISLLGEFVLECRDLIEKAEGALLTLETDPEENDAVNVVFRAFHTVKGTSGFLGIRLVSALAHLAENLLSRVRDKEIRCTGGYADLSLKSLDMMAALIETVQQALSGEPMRKPAGYDALLAVLRNPEAAGIGEHSAAEGAEDAGDGAGPSDGVSSAGGAPVQDGKREAEDAAAAAARGAKRSTGSSEGPESSIRLRTDRLDRLIDMVGELVIAQSMVAQDDLVLRDAKQLLQRKVAHSGKIVRELQDLSMSMRMVPLRPTFQKMARVARDLARKSGKQVDFVPSGEDTEIDRNMVDVLGDPLIHMVRNAMDHGVEPQDERRASGKDPIGRVELAAFHQGGNIVVELRDDGRGLDRERIVRKAVERGLIESDKGMSDADVYNLIFEAGFSTAETITEVSGRGVGMDVVRRAIQSLSGRVEISSSPGRGSVFSVRLPLTLAVTDGMLIRVGAQRFILPTVSIHMSFRPDQSALHTVQRRGEMVLLRGNLVPVVRLHRLFGISGASEDPTKALLVIVEDGDRHTGLMVDELLGQQQVVAKSLGDALGHAPGVSGAAILGDGRVGLILDPPGLTALARGGATACDYAPLLEMAA